MLIDNPFGSNQNYIRDLFNFDFVYIQNGIIKDDLSKYLNRYYRNIKLFVTSAQNEFNSIGDNNNLSIGFLIKEFMASSDVILSFFIVLNIASFP